MSLRKLLHSFIASSSSSSLYPLSNYTYRCSSIQRNYGSLFSFSTASSPLSVKQLPTDTLFHRLVQVQDRHSSVVPVLNQWVGEGRQFDYYNVRKIIKTLRNYKRFDHALQISEWMKDTNFKLIPGDLAVQLDLISKVHGLDQAEKFFNSMPYKSMPFQIYNSLLKCYVDAKELDKAEAFMEKMKKLGFAHTLAYNAMLNLYRHMGKHEKFNFLLQEMEEKGISYDTFTYCIRLNAYADVPDILGMEKLLMKMEADPMINMNWDAYGVAAHGYLKAGASEKAQMVLMKFEQLMRRTRRHHAYCVLITLYGRMGRKDDIYRVWNKYKNLEKFSSVNYITVMVTFVKLGDFDGAEQVLMEWLEKTEETKIFDGRVPLVLITAYCKMGNMEKAESLISKLMEFGHEPNTNTWWRMAWGYSRNDQMEKAVDMIEKSIISQQNQNRKPHVPTLAHCLYHLSSQGDFDRTRKIIGLLDEQGKFSEEFRNRLEAYIKENLALKECEWIEQESESFEPDDPWFQV